MPTKKEDYDRFTQTAEGMIIIKGANVPDAPEAPDALSARFPDLDPDIPKEWLKDLDDLDDVPGASQDRKKKQGGDK